MSFGVCYLAKTIEGRSREHSFARQATERETCNSCRNDHSPKSWPRLRFGYRLSMGPGLAKIGATSAVATGPYDVARIWSRAIHDHTAVPDGIAYRTKHEDDEICIALFDRALECVAAVGNPQPMTVDIPKIGLPSRSLRPVSQMRSGTGMQIRGAMENSSGMIR